MEVQMKILFLAANPSDTTWIRLDAEARSIEEMIELSEYRNAMHFRSRWAVRARDLLVALNKEKPQILHFSGHGSKSGLAFEADDGDTEPIRAHGLAKVIAAAGEGIRVVFLNACYSDEQATALESCVDCIIGMANGVSDEAATIFASSFYGALGFGRSIQNAFNQGVAALALKNLPDELTPRLRTRRDIDAREVFLVPH